MPVRIAVSGDLGSGKSTVCANLRSKYGLEVYSAGAIQRRIASEMGMSTLELNKYMENHPGIDRQIDDGLADLSDSRSDMAIDSRMAWHFVKNSFKVHLITDGTVAAGRVAADKRGPSEAYSDIRAAREMLKARKESENFRYRQKYGVDCSDLRNYDLIIDTTGASPEYFADLIISQYGLWADGGERASFWLSLYCLYPTRAARELSEETVGEYRVRLGLELPVPPADILSSGGLFYIYDGHSRAAAFHGAGRPLVPCSLLAENGEALPCGLTADQYARDGFDLSKAREWEEYNGFRYFTYPEQR